MAGEAQTPEPVVEEQAPTPKKKKTKKSK